MHFIGRECVTFCYWKFNCMIAVEMTITVLQRSTNYTVGDENFQCWININSRYWMLYAMNSTILRWWPWLGKWIENYTLSKKLQHDSELLCVFLSLRKKFWPKMKKIAHFESVKFQNFKFTKKSFDNLISTREGNVLQVVERYFTKARYITLKNFFSFSINS